jgi:hypothetical protein
MYTWRAFFTAARAWWRSERLVPLVVRLDVDAPHCQPLGQEVGREVTADESAASRDNDVHLRVHGSSSGNLDPMGDRRSRPASVGLSGT